VLDPVEQGDDDAGLGLDALDGVLEPGCFRRDEQDVNGFIEGGRGANARGPLPEHAAAQLDLRERRAAHDQRPREHGRQEAADASGSKHGEGHGGRNVLLVPL
jgi:hypothetical protein